MPNRVGIYAPERAFEARWTVCSFVTLSYKKKCSFIPLIFHNLSGYDCHLFKEELSAICGCINLIPEIKKTLFHLLSLFQ
ncbi:unnamed protein product [Parnassius mnemosyne]|uniref:DNA-directed DNA polymerase n=1 Tax=Parnassius mnemosyne TaxID=213953 RepID=A0AAV1L4S7_9NEOP